ncbi:hypothetical protein [Nocardia africana]|uniref:Tail terminator n=1 Tax=Nocardia africana TaxID=134964 RepID=A0A378X191_9NOCA|nr:hypothetical protein [Nocardia africana]MCC3311529.1 hypothetical protein [Nocardia africana]SUA47209.1 Uncharacterised protein [Nocardia africana]
MTPIPFAPGAVRAFLIAQPQFTARVPAAAITTRDLPDPLTAACVTLRAPGNVGEDPTLRKPLVQVDVWVPKIEILGGTTDPEELAWDVAALAGDLLARARPQEFRGSGWKARWTDGPITFVDTKRGPDNPLYRATIRVELKMRAPRH